MKHPYKIVTFWSERDNAFIATCPEFEGLATTGKTRALALKEAEAVLADFIEIYNEDGIPLPKPNPHFEYSGQVRLRISRYIHQKAAEQAEAEGLSLNAFLSGAVEARVAVHQYQESLLDHIAQQWMAATVNIIQNQISVSAPTNLFLESGQLPMMPSKSISSVGGTT